MKHHCIVVTFKAGQHTESVCLDVPGNEHIREEVKTGRVRAPGEYTDAEIARALKHHLANHGHEELDEALEDVEPRGKRGMGVLSHGG